MLTRSEAANLVEALNEAGFSCSLDASPTPSGGREYEVSIGFQTLEMGELRSLMDVVERFSDVTLVVYRGRVTIT
jgi:hypothetical protein